ncbi:MAG TPA: pyrrolo-quinoline quinone, partial [Candidatus Hydrogenedentes bacterium]|nr:pyrrolo-quinoline quinone [Candidatus Hydrogenedentota bacterium]
MGAFSRLTVAILAGCVAAAAPGDDWPQFRGVNRDARSPETGLLQQWPEEGLQPLWVLEGLGRGYASVSVAGERLFATGMTGEANEGVLSAIDLSGNMTWQTRYGPEWSK